MNWDDFDFELAELILLEGSLRNDFWHKGSTRRAIREVAGLTQQRLGELAGVDHSTIARWEHGTRIGAGSQAKRYESLLFELEDALQARLEFLRLYKRYKAFPQRSREHAAEELIAALVRAIRTAAAIWPTALDSDV
jgi:transcriptional regulator with XRE-family HTH domain